MATMFTYGMVLCTQYTSVLESPPHARSGQRIQQWVVGGEQPPQGCARELELLGSAEITLPCNPHAQHALKKRQLRTCNVHDMKMLQLDLQSGQSICVDQHTVSHAPGSVRCCSNARV